MILSFLAVLQTLFFSYLNRITILSPLFIVIMLVFFFQFLVSPLLLVFGPEDIYGNKEEFNQYALVILNIVIFFWFIGFSIVSKKKTFSFKEPNFKDKRIVNANKQFGFFCLFAGLFFYILIYLYSGYSYIEAFANPLQFRFDIISLTGGYYLRNLSLWLLNVSILVLLIFYFENIKESYKEKIKFGVLCVFLFFALIPFGQRMVLFIPFIAISFVLYNDNVISKKLIFLLIILGFLLLSITGTYRTFAYLGINNFQNLSLLFQTIDTSDLWNEFIARFDNLSWFAIYLEEELHLELSRNFFNSFYQSIILLFPPSLLGGIEKQIDYDTYLTIYFLGSQDFGTFAFTPMAEWSMNFGKPGYIIMPLLSGMITSYFCNNFRLIKVNMFHLIFFSSLMFIETVFISLHSYSVSNFILFIIFNIGLYAFYKLFFYNFFLNRAK